MVGRICGTGSYSPKAVWDNEYLSRMVDTSDEWIRERTGVARRHIGDSGETTAFMASEAARRALVDAGMDAGELELILVATISPEELMPCTACTVQREIEAERAVCFDVNSACTGFLSALNTAQAYLAAGIYRTALVIGAEKLSNLVNWQDRGTCILFGDGAGAVVLKADPEGIYIEVSHSEGKKGSVLTCESRSQKRYEDTLGAPETFIQMDGKEVFKFAVSRVPEVIREVLKKAGRSMADIRCYLLHQANRRIIESAARRLDEDIAKFPMNMEEYGNTSSASIPVLLDEIHRAGKLKSGDYLVLAGFGGGLTYGASLIRW